MSCGCKKKAAALNEPIKQPTNIQVSINENQTTVTAQTGTVDAIIQKLQGLGQ
jgi:ribosomal protein L6P/L9E